MQSLVFPFVEYLQTKKYSRNSIDNHRLDVNKLLQWLNVPLEEEAARLAAIAPQELQRYQEELQLVAKPRTVARHLSSLKLFFQYLVLRGICSRNAAQDLRFPEIVKSPPLMLSAEEISRLLDAPDPKTSLGLRDRAMLELAYSCGLKVNELINLNVDDLFFDLGFLKIRAKRERMVPLTQKSRQILEDYLQSARSQKLLSPNEPSLFPNRNGLRITRVGFWNLVKKYAQHAGLQANLNPRVLRHSFAMHLLMNGMDLADLKELFGYVDLNATLQYAHVNEHNSLQVYQQLHPRAQRHV